MDEGVTVKLVGLLCAFALASASAAFAQPGWHVVEQTDALTDERTRAACSTVDGVGLCMTFQPDGIWFLLKNAGTGIFGDEYPALRVGKKPAFDAVPAELVEFERSARKMLMPRQSSSKQQTWMQVPTFPGKYAKVLPDLIIDMLAADTLLVRLRLVDHETKDVFFPLAGFCAAAVQVAERGELPASCPGD